MKMEYGWIWISKWLQRQQQLKQCTLPETWMEEKYQLMWAHETD